MQMCDELSRDTNQTHLSGCREMSQKYLSVIFWLKLISGKQTGGGVLLLKRCTSRRVFRLNSPAAWSRVKKNFKKRAHSSNTNRRQISLAAISQAFPPECPFILICLYESRRIFFPLNVYSERIVMRGEIDLLAGTVQLMR